MDNKTIYIPDGFSLVYSQNEKKMVLRPIEGFSDKYLNDNQFVPLNRNVIEEDDRLNQLQGKYVNLRKAKKVKNDEFYTSLESIVKEVKHYKEQFYGKIVYCPCDKAFNKDRSNFFEYFSTLFHTLGLKQLICTQYNPTGNGEKIIFNGCGIRWNYNGEKPDKVSSDESEIDTFMLEGNGSFDSDECKKIMSQCDIVVTNPPFSQMRKFVAQIMELNKKFLIIGPENLPTYKEIFPLVKANKIWLGYSRVTEFIVPETEVSNDSQYYDENTGKVMQKFGNICWYTNLEHNKRQEKIPITAKYTPEKYPKYDNYDAIDVSRVKDIPMDYDGVMGVPVSFLSKYCPEQFEIIKFRKGDDNKDLAINGVCPYFRILIKHK